MNKTEINSNPAGVSWTEWRANDNIEFVHPEPEAAPPPPIGGDDNADNAFAREGGGKPKPGGSLSFEEAIEKVGDKHGLGFDAPIHAGSMSWFYRYGVDADVTPLRAAWVTAIENAYVSPEKGPDRRPGYLDELDERIEKARQKVINSPRNTGARPPPEPPLPYATAEDADGGIDALTKADAGTGVESTVAQRVGASLFEANVTERLKKAIQGKTGTTLGALKPLIEKGARMRKEWDDFSRKAKAEQARAEKTATSTRVWPGDVTEEDGKLWYPMKDKDGEPVYIDDAPFYLPLCQTFAMAAKLCDDQGEGVGRLMTFDTPLGPKEYEIDAGKLSGPAWNETVAGLRRLDFKLHPGEAETKFKYLLGELFTEEPDTLVRTYDEGGLKGDNTFLFPDGTVYQYVDPVAPVDPKASKEHVRLAANRRIEKHPPEGSLAGFQEAAQAAFSVPLTNYHIALGILVGVVSVPSGALDEMSRVLYATGPKATAKTTLQMLGVAAFSKVTPRDGGLMVSGALTENSVEDPLSKGNHVGSAIDEVAQMPMDAVGKTIFRVSGGVGKLRGTKDGGVRKPKRWSAVTTMTGEMTLEQIAVAAARSSHKADAKVLGGVIRRAPTISTAGAVRLSKDVMREIEAAYGNWGHFGPAFVKEFISRGHTTTMGRIALKRLIDEYAVAYANGNGDLEDPARLFALLKWCGRFCVETGLLIGVTQDMTDAVVQAGWDSFAGSRGAETLDGLETALEAFRVALVTGLNKNIHPLVERTDSNGQPILINTTPIGWYGEGTVYILQDEVEAMIGNYPVKAVLKQLGELGCLLKDEKRQTNIWRDIPGKGDLKNLRFDLEAMGVDDGDNEFTREQAMSMKMGWRSRNIRTSEEGSGG